jgi:heme/copper-type cytochrome/quinol oxidase subunit 3
MRIAIENRQYPPGDLAIWVFILAELLVFAIFFASYAFTRSNHVELFNTALLITTAFVSAA